MGRSERYEGTRRWAWVGAIGLMSAAATTFGLRHQPAGAGPAAPIDAARATVAPSTTISPSTTTTPAPRRTAPQDTVPLTSAPTTTSTSRSRCAGGYSSDDLNHLIHDSAAGGIVGADYARAQRLADGRVLWTFQDVFLGPDASTLVGTSFVHNAGLIQSGSCFRLLAGGTPSKRVSWIGGDTEVSLHSWFWPMDSMATADGNIALFLARFENPRGKGAAYGARPVGVWIAIIRPSDLRVVSLTPAPDDRDRPLYGFSVTSDEHHTYLYGNCYRQFTEAGFAHVHHDADCGPKTYVARIPRGRPEVTPEYWNGTAWSADRADAEPIMTRGRAANPMQVRYLGGKFVSVTKLDDWWGDTVYVDVAPSATGPWTTTTSFRPVSTCECSTYFAQLLPWTDTDGSLLIAISSNGWTFSETRRHAADYRTRFLAVPVAAAGRAPIS